MQTHHEGNSTMTTFRNLISAVIALAAIGASISCQAQGKLGGNGAFANMSRADQEREMAKYKRERDALPSLTPKEDGDVKAYIISTCLTTAEEKVEFCYRRKMSWLKQSMHPAGRSYNPKDPIEPVNTSDESGFDKRSVISECGRSFEDEAQRGACYKIGLVNIRAARGKSVLDRHPY
jgi:hypothetical protein